jgi:hypothetical protein
MDKFTQLLSASQFTRFVFGNNGTSDYVLADALPLSSDSRREVERRALTFVGVLGIVHGRPKSALAVPVDAATINAISQTFVRSALAEPAVAEQLLAVHLAQASSNAPMN